MGAKADASDTDTRVERCALAITVALPSAPDASEPAPKMPTRRPTAVPQEAHERLPSSNPRLRLHRRQPLTPACR